MLNHGTLSSAPERQSIGAKTRHSVLGIRTTEYWCQTTALCVRHQTDRVLVLNNGTLFPAPDRQSIGTSHGTLCPTPDRQSIGARKRHSVPVTRPTEYFCLTTALCARHQTDRVFWLDHGTLCPAPHRRVLTINHGTLYLHRQGTTQLFRRTFKTMNNGN